MTGEEYDTIQEIICQNNGFVYKKWYWMSYKDPNYPCSCRCHDKKSGVYIRHCFAPCCRNKSLKEQWMQLKGMSIDVPSKDVYFIFESEVRHPVTGRQRIYHVYLNELKNWTIK